MFHDWAPDTVARYFSDEKSLFMINVPSKLGQSDMPFGRLSHPDDWLDFPLNTCVYKEVCLFHFLIYSLLEGKFEHLTLKISIFPHAYINSRNMFDYWLNINSDIKFLSQIQFCVFRHLQIPALIIPVNFIFWLIVYSRAGLVEISIVPIPKASLRKFMGIIKEKSFWMLMVSWTLGLAWLIW